MEFGIKCCVPTIVQLGLNAAMYFLQDFQDIASHINCCIYVP